MNFGEAKAEASEKPWALIQRRLVRPYKQWTFYLVLVLGILVLGYLAVWIEAVHVYAFTPKTPGAKPELEPLKLACATGVLAVGVPCLMQLILTLNKMAIVLGLLLLFLVLVLAYTISYGSLTLLGIHFFGIIGLAIATFSWWLANGEDELFQDNPKFNAPSGGDPMRELQGGNSKVTV